MNRKRETGNGNRYGGSATNQHTKWKTRHEHEMKTEIHFYKKVFSHYGQWDLPSIKTKFQTVPEREVFTPIYFDRRINPGQVEYN